MARLHALLALILMDQKIYLMKYAYMIW